MPGVPDPLPDGPVVGFSPIVGRLARTDSFEEQRESTFAKVAKRISAEDAACALELLAFCREQECEFIRRLMAEWRRDLRELIRQRGADDEAITEVDERLAKLLAYPDGVPFDAEGGGDLLDAAFATFAKNWKDATGLARRKL